MESKPGGVRVLASPDVNKMMFFHQNFNLVNYCCLPVYVTGSPSVNRGVQGQIEIPC